MGKSWGQALSDGIGDYLEEKWKADVFWDSANRHGHGNDFGDSGYYDPEASLREYEMDSSRRQQEENRRIEVEKKRQEAERLGITVSELEKRLEPKRQEEAKEREQLHREKGLESLINSNKVYIDYELANLEEKRELAKKIFEVFYVRYDDDLAVEMAKTISKGSEKELGQVYKVLIEDVRRRFVGLESKNNNKKKG